jgi:hypothetical protein
VVGNGPGSEICLDIQQPENVGRWVAKGPEVPGARKVVEARGHEVWSVPDFARERPDRRSAWGR